ncbi:hypothetical protein DW667_08795 [Coprococcus sp. AM25-15LB]|jgi:predicted HicB family RNase H-like nuclease|uniref:hypothetical protein n=1 Tax=Faecalimonas umbilicata TaxID=1912855 RepID=UPI000E427AB6|nr:hypothetical protein [Faecalimonas umbilicata]MBS5763781.1 hypothetical protein [Lachnospiraceae bacterium]RGC74801.1 hypothetical protein DW667_08795 [Coprococcus sp. AM25-15LB]RJW07729.1 hypothetical protein DW686_08240 [Coprococcus sp. AM25-4LB]MBS6605345.1 hypothetical protein [Lachnospiraceae bacterium]MCI5987154.1 hypothetical protein [Faecalimonas umbilicata]
MSEMKKSSYNGYTPARKEANERYMKNFVEVKVRMTPEKRSIVQEHAAKVGESMTAFINRAIDETMKHDKN